MQLYVKVGSYKVGNECSCLRIRIQCRALLVSVM